MRDKLSTLAIVISLISLGVTMHFSELIKKLADSSDVLSPQEKQEIYLEARNIEQSASILNAVIKPGTQTLVIDNADINHALIDDAEITDATIENATITGATITNAEIDSATAGDGFITIDTNGISIDNNVQGYFSIKDAAGNRNKIFLTADGSNGAYFVNEADPNGGIWFRIKLTTGSDGTPELRLVEDPAQSDRPYLRLTAGPQGARFALDDTAKIDLRTEGSSGGSTFLRMLETTNTPPAGSTDAFHMYMKGDNLIIQYDAAGTPHYFYLNLTATSNQNWIYSATAP